MTNELEEEESTEKAFFRIWTEAQKEHDYLKRRLERIGERLAVVSAKCDQLVEDINDALKK